MGLTGNFGSTGATGAVGRGGEYLTVLTHTVGPATRLHFENGDPVSWGTLEPGFRRLEIESRLVPPTHAELTRQLSLLQRQNVVVEKAMQWYKREAEEWKALALLLMNTKPAQPAPDVAAAMRSPHADGFGACNPLVVR